MTDEDINWFQGIYPSWLEGIERSANAAIEEIHKMAVDAMPKIPCVELSARERLLVGSLNNPYVNMGQYQNIGMQGQFNSYSDFLR